MLNSRKTSLLISLVICSAGTIYAADKGTADVHAVSKVAPKQPLSEAAKGKMCVGPNNEAYSSGDVIQKDGSYFRCIAVYGQKLESKNMGWVEIKKVGPN